MIIGGFSLQNYTNKCLNISAIYEKSHSKFSHFGTNKLKLKLNNQNLSKNTSSCVYVQNIHIQIIHNYYILGTKMYLVCSRLIIGTFTVLFQLLTHIFKTLPLFFKTLHTNPRIAHTKCKMPHISCKMKHCIQNITNTSQKQTFANTFAIILIPVRFLCVA